MIVRVTDPDAVGTAGTTAVVKISPSGKGKLFTTTDQGQALPFGKKSLKQFSNNVIEVRDPATNKVLMHAKIPKM